MPIVKVEATNLEEGELPEGCLQAIQDAFVTAFGSERRYVDVRVYGVPPSRFLGQYEPGDGPIYAEVVMHTLPELGKRREAVLGFTHALADLFGRDPSAVNLTLVEAPKDRFAYGGRLLCDLTN